MSRQFSVPTILRMVPNDLLRAFFHLLGHGEFDPNWPELGAHEVDPLLDYITDLPNSRANVIEQELRSIYELSCDTGMAAIVEAAKVEEASRLVFEIPEALNIHGRATWVRLHYPQVFETALFLHQVDNLTWWRKRNDLPSNTPDVSQEAIDRLEFEISSLLKSQGRGKVCTVETYSRGSVDYFFAYPDDFVETAHMHDDSGKLTATAIRKTMQIVLAYDRVEGTLESYAKLNKPLKEQLERLFADCILHWNLGDHEPDKAYQLDHLNDESFELATSPRDCLSAQIVKMRLAGRTNRRRLLIEIDRSQPGESIHTALRECLNTEGIPLWHWNVAGVSIRFEFQAMPGRKPGHQTIDINFPRSCNLRSARPERVELIQKYLKLWGIDCVAAGKDGLVAVGA